MRKLVSLLLVLGCIFVAMPAFAAGDFTYVGKGLIFRGTDPTVQLKGTLELRSHYVGTPTFPFTGGIVYLTIDQTSGQSVSLNSRAFVMTDNNATVYGFQTKPYSESLVANPNATSVVGAEFSPRFNTGFSGKNLIGIQVDPITKGTGALAGDMRGIEVNIGDNYSASRSVAGRTVGIQIFHGFNGTLTGGSYGIAMDAAGGGKPYTAAFRFDAQAGLSATIAGATSAATVCGGGYVWAQIGAVVGYVPVCATP